MKLLTIFLRLTLCWMLLFLTRTIIMMFPNLLGYMNSNNSPLFLTIWFGILLYLSAILSYSIIFFTWRLLYLIDHKKIFSMANFFAIKVIKISFYSISICYLLAFVGAMEIAKIEKAPAPIMVDVIFIVVGLTMGIFTHLLQKIMQSALDDHLVIRRETL